MDVHRYIQVYLHKLNNKMARENHHILLLMDNAPSHPSLELLHVKLEFYPPNTTSKLQALNAGVTKKFKDDYQKTLQRSSQQNG